MILYVITPLYDKTTGTSQTTPVVHYFAKEWVKMGHTVKVFNFITKFPRPFYWASMLFQYRLSKLFDTVLPEYPKSHDYYADGVYVKAKTFKKIIPHTRFLHRQIDKMIRLISDECEKDGLPDYFIGHWDNPSLELLNILSKKYHKKTVLVLHGNNFNFESVYGKQAVNLLQQIDIIGFRNIVGNNNFVKRYFKPEKSFIAYSGVSENFLKEGEFFQKNYNRPIHNFTFVGMLIEQKFPKQVLTAVTNTFGNIPFLLTYIGAGEERSSIKAEYRHGGSKGKIVFTGRIPRANIIKYLKETDVFVMISKNEVFGLVYLEAMALGIIPIGSKNEGIDGIIEDGVNGFLCEAGNVDELSVIINTIQKMPIEKLNMISYNAKKTAHYYSDFNVAKRYLEHLK